MTTIQEISTFSPILSEEGQIWGTETLANILAFLALIISVIALLVSIYYSRKTYIQAFRINKTNIEIDYYKKIFDKYILVDIPEKRRNLSFEFSNNTLSISPKTEFENLLADLLVDIEFFSFKNNEFYKNIKNIVMELDDQLVSHTNIVMNFKQRTLFYKRVDVTINRLYNQIFESCLGEK